MVPVLALLFAAVSATADPPVIESIAPASGPVTGGTRVTIRGRNLGGVGSPCPDEASCPVSVVFVTPHPDPCCITGKAKVLFASDTRIDFETPEHGNGPVDVYVTTAAGKTVARNGYHFGRSGFRRVLVPVAWRGVLPGAFGSAWATALTGRVYHPNSFLEVTRTPFSDPPHRVQNSFLFEDLPQAAGGGFFLYVPEGRQLYLSLRARDVSRQDENFGTEVPLVTAEQTSPAYSMQFLDLPITPKYRSTLRIYNFEGKRASAVTVIIRTREGNDPIVFRTYHSGSSPIEEFPSVPGYLQLNVDDLLPPGYTGFVDIEAGNAFPGPRLWAMVSVTNNETQMVTMVTPALREQGGGSLLPR